MNILFLNIFLKQCVRIYLLFVRVGVLVTSIVFLSTWKSFTSALFLGNKIVEK